MKPLNKKISLILAAIMMSLMFVACGKDKDDYNTPQTTNNAPFTFLKVGNEWELYSPNIPDGYNIAKRKVLSQNGNILKLKNSQEDWSDTFYWKLTDDNWIASCDSAGNDGYVFCPRNCYVGQQWDIILNNTITIPAKIISITDTVIVPAGTFTNCIKIEWQTIEIGDFGNEFVVYDYYYLHKDYGIILQEDYSSFGCSNAFCNTTL